MFKAFKSFYRFARSIVARLPRLADLPAFPEPDGWWAAGRRGSTLIPAWGLARNVHYALENIGNLV
jgi:hypothetical protein